MRKLQRGSYELCSATKPLRAMSFHDQFRYTPETKNLGPVLLRSRAPNTCITFVTGLRLLTCSGQYLGNY